MASNTYVIGDIHGALLALEDLLNQVKPAVNDTLIFLGDYVDGWSDVVFLINYLIDIQEKHNCIFIKGNHDELFLNYLKTNTFNEEWLKHGGQSTLEAYSIVDETTKNKHINFLENLTDYYLDEQNRLFIHAGYTNPKGIDYEYFSKMFYWDRSLWEMAVALNPKLQIDDLHYPQRLKNYSEIYIGHTPTTRLNSTCPIQHANVINVDTGVAFKGPLTMMDISTKKFWQSKPAFELYPNERGRN
jgi:serine/threonine protein phosphatase 1